MRDLRDDLADLREKWKAGQPITPADRAKTKPQKDTPTQWPKISASQLRLLTGLTDRRHRQLADQGYFRPPVRGVYGSDVVAGLFKYFQEQLHRKNDALAREQLELTRAKRETVQEELALLRAQYIPKSEIGPALRNVALHQRSILQRKLENELGPALSTLKTSEILERLRRAVDDICAVFRDGIKEWVTETAEAAAPAAAAPIEIQPTSLVPEP